MTASPSSPEHDAKRRTFDGSRTPAGRHAPKWRTMWWARVRLARRTPMAPRPGRPPGIGDHGSHQRHPGRSHPRDHEQGAGGAQAPRRPAPGGQRRASAAARTRRTGRGRAPEASHQVVVASPDRIPAQVEPETGRRAQRHGHRTTSRPGSDRGAAPCPAQRGGPIRMERRSMVSGVAPSDRAVPGRARAACAPSAPPGADRSGSRAERPQTGPRGQLCRPVRRAVRVGRPASRRARRGGYAARRRGR
jgi:hypothetical protein